jgi:large subunit ribosomal protein L6
MARLGRKTIVIPGEVNVTVSDDAVEIKGPKGTLYQKIPQNILVKVTDGKLVVENTVPADNRKMRKLYKRTDALQGLIRSRINNMITGVTRGYEKVLEIHGTGYKAELKGKKIVLRLGFTHPVETELPDGVSAEIIRDTIIFLRAPDKDLLGDYAAKVRHLCPPESYKGKGIRYRGEYVRHKVGKAAIGTQK